MGTHLASSCCCIMRVRGAAPAQQYGLGGRLTQRGQLCSTIPLTHARPSPSFARSNVMSLTRRSPPDQDVSRNAQHGCWMQKARFVSVGRTIARQPKCWNTYTCAPSVALSGRPPRVRRAARPPGLRLAAAAACPPPRACWTPAAAAAAAAPAPALPTAPWAQ